MFINYNAVIFYLNNNLLQLMFKTTLPNLTYYYGCIFFLLPVRIMRITI